MKKRHPDFSSWRKRMLRSPQFKAEYNKQQPEFALIRAMIDARIKRRLTQEDLAHKMQTKQSVISRLERGHGNPTVSFLKKLANAFSAHLEIRFVQ